MHVDVAKALGVSSDGSMVIITGYSVGSTSNYDYATGTVVWDSTNSNHSLPESLYLSGKPAFFGSEAWPFVDPTRNPMVGVLPAKKRFDALPR